MAGREKDGRQLSLEDGRVGGKGVRSSVVFHSALVEDIARADTIVHPGAIREDGDLTRASELGMSSETFPDHLEGRERVDSPEIVSGQGDSHLLKQGQPVSPLRDAVAFGSRTTWPIQLSENGVAKCRMHGSLL